MKINNKYKASSLRHNLGHYPIPLDTEGMVAVDIGCNNGCFLDQCGNHFSVVHAYEANHFLVGLLKDKFENEDIKIFHNAVSSEDGLILELLAAKTCSEDGSFSIKKEYVRQDWEEFVCEAPSISLEAILKKLNNNVDYMKIDCETSEYELLMNKDLKPIKYIAVELHDQLGREKYSELYNFICQTHNVSAPLNYREGHHQEIFFVRR